MRFSRLQSAMEYLMTYGWSILLIAIVIAAIFELGVFSNNPLSSSNTCLPQSGYLCSKPQLNSTGVLNVTFGQSYGSTYTITGVACTNSSNSPTSFNSIAPLLVYTGQPNHLDFQCPISSGVIGTPFSGSLWIQYNTATLSGQQSKIGIVNAKVTTTGGEGSLAFPSGSVSLSVPITLTNLQSSPTGSNFQQILSINSNQYSAYINSGWTNVEFTTGNAAAGSPGTVLQAWVESNATNTASHTITWVNLASGIPAISSVTIYMDVMSGNVMSASGPTGEAPQLSSTYAQYDNGGNVFSSYWNFAGNTLPSGWVVMAGRNHYTVSNGILVYAGSNGGFVQYNSTFNYNTAIDWYGYYDQNGIGMQLGLGTFVSNNGMFLRSNNNVLTYLRVENISAPGTYKENAVTYYGDGVPTVYGFTYVPSISGTPYSKYVAGVPVANSLYVFPSYPGLYISTGTGGDATSNVYVQWLRLRNYPPGGVIPTQTTGLGTPSQIVHYVPITITNSQGTQVSPNTQVMVSFNPSTYHTYEANSLQNVEFFYSNGTVIPSWLEGNALSEMAGNNINLFSATNVLYWVKIAPGFSTSMVIYAGFAPTTTSFYSASGSVGVAPQLFCASGCPETSYAQYDNGAGVFNFYDNFAGTSLAPSWTANSGLTVSVNNGININRTVSTWLNIQNTYSFSQADVDTYMSDPSGGFGAVSTSGGFASQPMFQERQGENRWLLSNSAGSTASLSGTTANVLYVMTGSLTNSAVTLSVNYASTISVSNSGGSGNLQVLAGSTIPTFFQWIRVRTYPPNGVLPGISFGSFT